LKTVTIVDLATGETATATVSIGAQEQAVLDFKPEDQSGEFQAGVRVPNNDPYVEPQVPMDPYVAGSTKADPYIAHEANTPKTDPYVAPTPKQDPYVAPAQTTDPYVAPASKVDPYVAQAPKVDPYVPQTDPYVAQGPKVDPWTPIIAMATGFNPDPYAAMTPTNPQQQTVQHSDVLTPNHDPYSAQPTRVDPYSTSIHENATHDPYAPKDPYAHDPYAPQPKDPYVAQPKDQYVASTQPNYGGATQSGVDSSGIMEDLIDRMAPPPPPTEKLDPMEERIEVSYISSNTANPYDTELEHDWRTEVAEKQDEARREEEANRLKREEEKEKEEQEQKELEERAKRFADAMLLQMATRKAKADADIRAAKDQQNAMLLNQQRQKYVVLKGDTLESIALKKLRDRRLAALLYEINKSLIPFKLEKGKKLLQLRPRTVIFLPTPLEIKRYQSRLFGRPNVKFDYDENVGANMPEEVTRANNPGLIRGETTSLLQGAKGAASASSPVDAETMQLDPSIAVSAQKRRANVESLLGNLSSQVQKDGRIRYVCRLGDSLRSVAKSII
jgi:hypothetical protein